MEEKIIITVMKKFSVLFENNINHDGILVIVDVQKEFSDFIPKNLVSELHKYAENFETVYQVWDSNKAQKPSYTFPNEKKSVVKKYGTTFSNELTYYKNNLKDVLTKEGDRYKFNDTDSYLIKVGNKHAWFYMPEEMSDLLKTLNNKNVILVGGAKGECLYDVEIAMKSFGINPIYNNRYVYSAKTNNSQLI